jgi:ubiquitin carboxyl-terminal hydrolase L5
VLGDTVNTLPVAKDVSAAVECIEKDLEAPTEASTAAKAPKANGTQANTSKQSPKADLYTRSEIADKNVWQGWCEIESEPANFNLMLKEYGVKGVRVLDIYTLDGLEDLPQPVYGAVLLFRYRDVGVEDETEPCPDSLWFANQTAENACATTALLNLMLNAPDVDLGENLTQFKAFTKDFTPFLRGQEIANFEFVKRIHNSFAKKIDILNVDLCMKNEYDARNKPVKKRKATKVKEEDDDEDVPYHFIAFVPVDGSVWRLDGLDREPSRIGTFFCSFLL